MFTSILTGNIGFSHKAVLGLIVPLPNLLPSGTHTTSQDLKCSRTKALGVGGPLPLGHFISVQGRKQNFVGIGVFVLVYGALTIPKVPFGGYKKKKKLLETWKEGKKKVMWVKSLEIHLEAGPLHLSCL